MSNVFKLSDLRDSLNEKYAPLVLEEDGKRWELQSPMRLSTEARQSLKDIFDEMSKTDSAEEVSVAEQEAEQRKSLEAILRLIVKKHADSLIQYLGGDNLLLVHVFEQWKETTQPGEASPSQS